MVKQKKSFMERLTGSKKIEDAYEPNHMEHMQINSDDSESRINMPPSHHEPEEMMHHEDQSIGSWGHHDESTSIETSEEDDGQLTIDVYQTDNEIVLKSTIAGVKPEDLDVSINNDMVTIKGERRSEEEVSEENYYYQECYWGGFSRSVVLPVDVLPEKAEASLKNGILTIRLPKAEVNKVKKIQVRGF
ncbi:MAG: Hsp20/alpha crystallin family protein [Candidatus Moranbacteria bacterium]|nr:Hsp20/alpha crystallin family protein [Candidatus Moranbacteria bacterium]